MVINSISANELVTKGLIIFYPRGIHFDNYLEVFKIRDIGNAALVSLGRTVIGTASGVLCTSFVAYVLTKQNLWHRKLWYRFFIITLYFNVGLIPWYINMQFLHLTNNFLAYVIAVINPYNLVLVKTFMESIPPSLVESAEIDGAGTLTSFFRIVLPLSKPILATISIFTAVLHWNQYQDSLILMNNRKLFTLQHLLLEFFQNSRSLIDILQGSGAASMIDPSKLLTPTSIRMTISIVLALPILCVYPFFQKYFVKGIMLGAVKG
jgi:putative aldouronate transport system permease protein